jgi:hypothetical protein
LATHAPAPLRLPLYLLQLRARLLLS